MEDNKKGKKYDQGKLRFELIPPVAIEEIAKVQTFGANKYGANSWQNLENAEERYLGALYRHLNAHQQGETFDLESGLSHLSHALTNLVFLVYFEQTQLKQIEVESILNMIKGFNNDE